jgi:hypothetical protein
MLIILVYKLVLPKCDIKSTMLVKAKETAKEERSYILSGMHCFLYTSTTKKTFYHENDSRK